MAGDKILRVIGMANTMAPPGKVDDNAAQRRISIVILTREQEAAIRQENMQSASEEIDGGKDATAQLWRLASPPAGKESAPTTPMTSAKPTTSAAPTTSAKPTTPATPTAPTAADVSPVAQADAASVKGDDGRGEEESTKAAHDAP
ncbi:hypothetical protein [Candidatus Sodalis endolongispinus]|uniref:hypothetical protein n=1 Tax=Candidatus Sodalis endolongispinus TaxID=2812662 RepID=UPI001FE3BC68|nr:hypothetical protein [Candidatus Sodalis endolongispinus]